MILIYICHNVKHYVTMIRNLEEIVNWNNFINENKPYLKGYFREISRRAKVHYNTTHNYINGSGTSPIIAERLLKHSRQVLSELRSGEGCLRTMK